MDSNETKKAKKTKKTEKTKETKETKKAKETEETEETEETKKAKETEETKEAKEAKEVGERIRKVRKAYNLTQQLFADKLRLKQNTVATYEIGKTTPSDRTILDICRVFHVNETWLRTGEGDMLLPPPNHNTPDEELLGFLGDVSREASFRSRLIYALSRLSDEDWAVLERLARDLTAPDE